MKRRTVLSMEQALSLPSATLRFAQLGWRVIRIEATPSATRCPAIPTATSAARVADDDRRSYFVAPNVGKEAIALNLKDPRGHEVLRAADPELNVDVFCCNTVPSRYEALGIDYETLSAAKPDLIWAGISALGPEYPDVPGYDPVIQAMSGYMEVTGDPNGPPMLTGMPVIDLKAGDEVYANVMLALLERAETGRGKAHRRLDAAGRGVVADHGAAAGRLRLPARRDHARRQRAPQVHPDQRVPGARRVRVHGDRQRRAVEAAHRDPSSRPSRTKCARRTRAAPGARPDPRRHRGGDAQHTAAEIRADLKRATIPNTLIHDIPMVRDQPALSDG